MSYIVMVRDTDIPLWIAAGMENCVRASLFNQRMP